MSTEGGKMSKYPAGEVNQHKSLATGAALETVDSRDLDPSGWGEGESAKEGKIRKSGTSTGSGSGKAGY